MLGLILALAFPIFAQAAQPPRLLLVISVDQMRADYWERFTLSKGFGRLRREGAFFTDAHHVHVPTETGPGHAAILTGKTPSQSGIVGNDWFDRATGKMVYNMGDSVHGTGPENMTAYTIGDALKARDPKTKVVGVSIKDRGAIPMAGKRADLAVWYDKKKGRAVTSTYYGVPPAWLEKLTAPEAILEAPAGDEFVLKLALEALERYALGKDDVVDVLTVSFSAPDYVGHRYGIDGPELSGQFAALDETVEKLLKEAEKRAGKGRLLVALTSDHGVVPDPDEPSGKALGVRKISVKAMGDALEAELQKAYPAEGKKWVLAPGVPNIYLNRALAQDMKADWSDLLDKAAAAVAKNEGIAEVYTSENYVTSELMRNSYFAGRSGDLLVVAKPAVLFSDYPGTSHGTPYAYDTNVPLVFWGEAIKAGEYKDKARVGDLAPTLAKVLGLDFPPAQGAKVRVEALK